MKTLQEYKTPGGGVLKMQEQGNRTIVTYRSKPSEATDVYFSTSSNAIAESFYRATAAELKKAGGE